MRGTREGEEKETPKRATAVKVNGEIIRPYIGKKDLPLAAYGRTTKSGKGRIIKAGEPRHFLARVDKGTYKLIKVYRAHGLKRSLVRVLKTDKKDARGKKDLALLKRLSERGIPGAVL